MLIKQSEAKKIENTEACIVHEYHFPSELMSVATAKIKGRYPEKGKCTNKECEETYFVMEGKGMIHSEKGDFEIEKGDVYHFEKGEKYWVEGDLYLALTNAPPFDPGQHELLD
ncbi:hypothetical protein ACFL0V_02445 [Nanoarchaeota archaeon]